MFGWQRLVDPETAAEYSFILDTAGVNNAAAVTAGDVDKSELGIVAIRTINYVRKQTLDRPTPYFLSLTSIYTIIPN